MKKIRTSEADVPDTEGSCGDALPELDREGDEVDELDLVGDTGSRLALKLPRPPALPRFVGVLGSLSIGTAGAKALLCTCEHSSSCLVRCHTPGRWQPFNCHEPFPKKQ